MLPLLEHPASSIPCTFTDGSRSDCPQRCLSWGCEAVLQHNGGCCHANQAGSRHVELPNQESSHATGDGLTPGCPGGLLSPAMGCCSSVAQPKELSFSGPMASPSTGHSSVREGPGARSPHLLRRSPAPAGSRLQTRAVGSSPHSGSCAAIAALEGGRQRVSNTRESSAWRGESRAAGAQ